MRRDRSMMYVLIKTYLTHRNAVTYRNTHTNTQLTLEMVFLFERHLARAGYERLSRSHMKMPLDCEADTMAVILFMQPYFCIYV